MLNQIALLIPVFFGIAMLEWYITYRQGKHLFSGGSTVMNMTLGAVDQLFSLIDFLLLFTVLSFVYEHFRLFTLEKNWIQWVLAYVAVDFVSYWYHRFSHRINLLWAGHITHHSGDHFNYTNGFRGSPFQGLNRIPFWIVLPLVGFDPLILVLTLQISGIYDFWLHTQTIPKLGFLEKILITPSLHRVHHGKNDIYIDKNYGSTFLIWDQMFGTYQKETEPVVYGIKSEEYVDDDPVKAITWHYAYLWNALRSSRDKIAALKLLFMPPEWKLPDGEAHATHEERTVRSDFGLRNLAYVQLAYGSIGLVAMLLVKNIIPLPLFLGLGAVVVPAMVNSARIINRSLKQGFQSFMYLRLALTAVLLTVQLYMYHAWWLLIPLACIGISSFMLQHRLREVHRKDSGLWGY